MELQHLAEGSRNEAIVFGHRLSSISASARRDFLQLAETFAWINPHLDISLSWLGEPLIAAPPTAPEWTKWLPSAPTSPHWYSVEALRRLIAAEVALAEDNGSSPPSVREFIAEFRGLSATAKTKAICDRLGLARRTLADLVGDGSLASRLLDEMKNASRPPRPKDLGVIGRDHLIGRFVAAGAEEDTFDYRTAAFDYCGLPYVVETAFAYAPGLAKAEVGLSGEEAAEAEIERERKGRDRVRRMIAGLNFSVSAGANPFRRLGDEGLDGLLSRQYAGPDEPVIVFAHLAAPRLDFLDKGKSSVALPWGVGETIVGLVEKVTDRWAKQRKAEIRSAGARSRRMDMLSRRDRPVTIKEAAWNVMRSAYLAASANGTMPVNPRQIYYRARGEILRRTGRERLDSGYFSQTLLIDFIEETGVDWDIVWDDRGHFVEPHTGRVIGLGTLAVREYLADARKPFTLDAGVSEATVKTSGPSGRFGGILFLEKEGFTPILEAARIAERFDIAVMSTKGMSVTAARLLVDRLCGQWGVRLYVLHDFDIAGFSIKKTLTESGRRYRFMHAIDYVDLGLRLADVEALDLESEPVAVEGDDAAIGERLRVNGAAEDEIKFLLSGRRVELNAMASDVFVSFVERKLVDAGAKKVVPGATLMAEAYRALTRAAQAEAAFAAEIERINGEAVAIPDDLERRVNEALAANPATTWDAALRLIAEGERP